MVEERRVTRQEGPPLQCPRCGSHNTKFCYYNNYNTAQPRHFCRGCQRYWTHGGALRNIPAGGSAGRKRSRRNEMSSSKMPRIDNQVDRAPSSVIEGSVLSASLNLNPILSPPPPPQPAPFFYSGDHGVIPGLGFSGPLPTLQLFNNIPGVSVNGGFRGFHPFNPLVMSQLPFLHGLTMQQHMAVNGGDIGGSSNGGNSVSINGANVGDGNDNQDGNGDQGLFVNQFLTRFGNEGGEETRVTFNSGNTGANQNPPSHPTNSTDVTSTSTTSGVTPAKFM